MHKKMRIKFCWVPTHSRVTCNELVDQEVANEAAKHGAIELPIPLADYLSTVKRQIARSLNEE